jgi:pimeloyl-ACP methyl ester carboxylesterase
VETSTRHPRLDGHREGSGAPLLLLPGLGGTRAEFGAVLPELARRHDVLTLSQAACLAFLVPGARFRVLPFAGHSSVADVPERVVRLVDEAAASR